MPKKWSKCACVITTDHGSGVTNRTAAAIDAPCTSSVPVSMTRQCVSPTTSPSVWSSST